MKATGSSRNWARGAGGGIPAYAGMTVVGVAAGVAAFVRLGAVSAEDCGNETHR